MLASDREFMVLMEAVRCAGSVRMGLAADTQAAGKLPSIPKVAIVAPARATTSLSGERIAADRVSLIVRMLSMGQPHRAVPITGAICLAIAARIPGSIPFRIATATTGPLTIAHPSGSILVDAEVGHDGGAFHALSGSVYRTARKLFAGSVFYRIPSGRS